MKVHEAPNVVPDPFYLFLGGGITNCPDWQEAAIHRLGHMDIEILNPRRANFPMGDPAASEIQIKWEHKMLRRAHLMCFWFPKETLCPITLYELGYWSSRRLDRIVVGVHRDYQRKVDVKIQTQLLDPSYPVYEGFDEFMHGLEVKIMLELDRR